MFGWWITAFYICMCAVSTPMDIDKKAGQMGGASACIRSSCQTPRVEDASGPVVARSGDVHQCKSPNAAVYRRCFKPAVWPLSPFSYFRTTPTTAAHTGIKIVTLHNTTPKPRITPAQSFTSSLLENLSSSPLVPHRLSSRRSLISSHTRYLLFGTFC